MAGACASAVLAGELGLTRVIFVAWYDTDLKSYQKERTDTELERVFEEKIDTDYSILHESKFGEYMAKPMDKTEETEWQKLARKKNAGEKIKEVSCLLGLGHVCCPSLLIKMCLIGLSSSIYQQIYKTLYQGV